MLRITIHDNPGVLTLQIEGRLIGPWVRELEKCWRSTLNRRLAPTVRVDLTGMTSLDAAGRACLAFLYHQGAEFVAADCLTKAVVAEITGGSSLACELQAANGETAHDRSGTAPLPERQA